MSEGSGEVNGKRRPVNSGREKNLRGGSMTAVKGKKGGQKLALKVENEKGER